MKDYAHRPARARKPKRKKALLTTLIIVLAITVPALMYYVRFKKATHHQYARPSAHKTTAPKTTLHKTKSNNTEFDFYTILPKGEGAEAS